MSGAQDRHLSDAARALRVEVNTLRELVRELRTEVEQAAAARNLLRELVDEFIDAVDNDAEIDGGDAVQWLSEFVPRARDALAGQRKAVESVKGYHDCAIRVGDRVATVMKPSRIGTVRELGDPGGGEPAFCVVDWPDQTTGAMAMFLIKQWSGNEQTQ